MAETHFERLIALAESTFQAHNDPDQLDVDEAVIARLQEIHPATLSEYNTPDGPALWVLLIPTVAQVMRAFLNGDIGEKELLKQTPQGSLYDSIYLCSALTLEEYRHKGLTLKTALNAIEEIRATHPIKYLFVWNYTPEGAALAKAIAEKTGIPMLEKS